MNFVIASHREDLGEGLAGPCLDSEISDISGRLGAKSHATTPILIGVDDLEVSIFGLLRYFSQRPPSVDNHAAILQSHSGCFPLAAA